MVKSITKILILLLLLGFPLFNNEALANNSQASMAQIKEYIVKTAVEMGVEPEFALSVAKIESGFSQEKRSVCGAIGVYQLMPSTARKLGYNPYNYKENIKAGITYLKNMNKIYKSKELVLAAYNAGPGNVKKYGGVPPFAETKRFISKNMAAYNEYKNNPDDTVAQFLANRNMYDPKVAEQEHLKVITTYMSTQAI